MSSLKKYPIIIISILILSTYFVDVYEDLFSKRSEFVRIEYSPVSEDFMKTTYPIGNQRKPIFSNLDGTEVYKRAKFMEFFPFKYYSDLVKWGTFPEKLASFENNGSVIMSSKQYSYIRQKYVDQKDVGLFPLFESASKFSSLEMPEDFFRFNSRIEFIVTQTNKINEEKSELFTKALLDKNVQFPIKRSFGKATTRKPFDEGYFILDAKNELYHFKMIKSKPFVKKIKTNGINIKYIAMDENSRREYFGLVLSENNKVYLLMHEDYEFLELPIDGYNYKNQNFLMITDPLYRHISIEGYDERTDTQVIKNYVTNLDYEVIAKNIYEYPIIKDTLYETTKELLFPFELIITKDGSSSYYIKLDHFNKKAFLLNLLLVIAYLAYIKMSKRKIKEHLINSMLLLSSGIYAIISIFIFARIFYFRKKI